MENLPKDKKIILFDGVCNLCDASVQLIIKHDENDVFRFVALQSELGQQILKHIGVDISVIESILLYEPGIAYYYKAEAVMRISKNMNGWYPILSYFSFLGKSVNFIYDFVAKNRYKWYGKKESCMIPTPELKSKFL
ncbi:thiol-disulfide oxidoreductase DCC family protein [Flavobacterium sp.]|uniref:thiol-disulfide oxidoreductase DCC family protein n=1 Tax=Flavobacterium sp. TaxID=239 RepID=UPI002603846F|nr:DCC1-like thiol-disulfide oxidoreductase family protein [Flavobacterium sp.]